MSRSACFLAVISTAVMFATAAVAQTPMTPSTQDFISAAAQSDHFEILEAQTALTQSHDARLRSFAQDMIDAHIRTGEALAQAAAKANLGAPPQGLGGDQQKLLGGLQSERGVEFDHTYVKQQILAHQQALVVEQAYATQGSNPDLKVVAEQAVPVIRRHLQMAEALGAEIAKP